MDGDAIINLIKTHDKDVSFEKIKEKTIIL